jgi:uncharacterized protein DUF6259
MSTAADTAVLRSGALRVEIEPEHGRIVRLGHAKLGVEVVTEPRLAENFRLLVPLPHRRGHYVAGRDQPLAELRVDGDRCWLRWHGVASEEGRFDVDVTQTIQLSGDDVTVRTEVANHSPYQVEEVANVVLGGMGNATERTDWRLHFANGGGQGEEWSCYDTFPGSYLGPARPVWTRMYPGGMAMPWIDLYHVSGGKGLYVGNHDPQARQSVVWSELTPCTTYGGPGGDGQYWPDPDRAGGEPVGMALSWNSIPFVRPGTTWQGPPIVLHFHEGTWWAAAEYFRSWYDATIAAGRPPIDQRRSWLATEDAWQSTIISYPDGTIGYRFRDLPAMARQAREAGITVLQIDGWDIGGIDRDYPRYSPDPRLGTAEELREALAECRRLGVYVMLFANLQWVNVETDWYDAELHRYVVRDPHGNPRGGMGWEYNTTLGLLGQPVHRMVMANPARPEFQRIILDQLANTVRLGGAGTQIDKLGALAQVDYAPDNPLPPADAVPAGALETLARFHRRARREAPEFCLAAEMHWDRAVPYVDASYSRFFTTDHLPTFAAAFPEYRQSCCVTGDFDYGLVNNCLRFGHVVNVEARCLHATVAEAPHLGRYVAEALRVRRALRDRIWDSRLVDPRRAGVQGPPEVRYCLHRGTGSGRFTVVLNHFDAVPHTVEIGPLAGNPAAVVHRPYTASQQIELPCRVEIPPEEFVIVTEAGSPQRIDPPATRPAA